MLRRRQRLLGYRATRNAWMRCGGNLQVAEVMLKEELKLCGFNPAVIALILQMAYLAWQLWKELNVDDPESTPSLSTPGGWVLENDDDEDGEDD